MISLTMYSDSIDLAKAILDGTDEDVVMLFAAIAVRLSDERRKAIHEEITYFADEANSIALAKLSRCLNERDAITITDGTE